MKRLGISGFTCPVTHNSAEIKQARRGYLYDHGHLVLLYIETFRGSVANR